MTRSLRLRLLIWVIGAMAIIQIAFAAVVYEEMERSLHDGFNEMLMSSVRTVAASIEQDEDGIDVETEAGGLPNFEQGHHPDYFEVWTDPGAVVARSPSLGLRDLPRPASAGSSVAFRRIHLPDGRHGKAAVVRWTPRAHTDTANRVRPIPVTLVVARGTTAVDSELSFLLWLLSIGTGGGILVSLVFGTFVVHHGLAPLRQVAARIAGIDPDDLSARIPSADLPSELAPVVHRLNDLLHRLESAFRRERALTADVAHELRTPLAGLRSTIEVALARPRDAGEYREALAECQDIVGHGQRLTSQLLALARMEGRQTNVSLEAIPVAPIIASATRSVIELSAARQLAIDLTVPDDLACRADRDLLLTAISELAANAVEYTPAGGRLSMGARAVGGHVEMWCSNPAPGLQPDDASHVFDRFWRGDASRSQTGVHSGLGLTLVQQSLQAMNGSVDASLADGTFTVRLILPSAPYEVVS